jgi:hypothetical protein
MKSSTVLPFLGTLALLTGNASAWWAQLSIDYTTTPILNLLDYYTGSTYSCGTVYPSYCTVEYGCPV